MRKGISTIIATIILVVITIGLISTAYLYFSGLISGATRGTIQLLDAYCTGTTITIIIQNKGTSTIANPTWIVDGSTQTDPGGCDDSIAPDGSATCTFTGTANAINEIRVVGPANAVGGSVMCR